MPYCSAGDTFTYLDSPEFYSTTLYTLGCLYLPFYTLGAYCIITKTPEDMKSIKWTLLNFHLSNCFVDVLLSLLTTPYLLCPLLAGWPMGLLSFFGMSTLPQLYLVYVSQALMAVAILFLFENRYFIISSSENGFWLKARVPFIALNYLIAFTYIWPAYNIILNDPVPKSYLEEVLPCLPERVLNADVFVVRSDHPVVNFTGPVYIIFLLIEGFIFYFLITVSLKNYGNQHSEKTMKMQTTFIRSLKLQIALPFVIFVVPVFYNTISGIISYRNQFLYNVSYIILSSHGLCSTVALLMIHKPYKKFIGNLLGKSPKLNPIPSNQVSVVTIL